MKSHHLTGLFTLWAFLLAGCECDTSKTADQGVAEQIPTSVMKQLSFADIETVSWIITMNSGFGDNKFQFRYQDSAENNIRMKAVDSISPGELFFKEEPVKNRFKIIKQSQRTVLVGERDVPRRFVIIEDQRPNKLGFRFEAPYRPPRDEISKHYQFDHTVTFLFGEDSSTQEIHTVQENESFSVTVDGQNYQCKLTKVTINQDAKVDPLSLEVEWSNGRTTVTRKIIP